MKIPSVKLLDAAIATGAGASHDSYTPFRTFQATGATGSGAGAATVTIEVSDVDVPTANDWIVLGTITLTLGTTSTTDGFASTAAWRKTRANVTAISGTGATVHVWMGAGNN
jgi:hypothetical protein